MTIGELPLIKGFISVLLSWMIAGLSKYVIALLHDRRKASIVDELMRTGGMPSAHSASVAAVSASVWFAEGLSTLFFVTIIFSVLVIRDSYGVRWSVGEQAKVLNRLLKHDDVHRKVDVILGHTVSQANIGILLGLAVTVLVHLLL